MKLQLKVFSGSRWATENRKQTQKAKKGQPEGTVPRYKNNSLFSLSPSRKDVEAVGLIESAEKL